VSDIFTERVLTGLLNPLNPRACLGGTEFAGNLQELFGIYEKVTRYTVGLNMVSSWNRKMKWDFHNNQISMAVLILITALNIGLIINFLTANTGGTGFGFNGIQLYVLAGLELAGVIAACMISKRRNTTVSF
jgi:hypothetical protein